MSNETFPVWVSKYALTAGIQQKMVARGGGDCAKHLYPVGQSSWTFYIEGRDAFLVLEDAIKDAESRRKRKVASLTKQIASIEAMKFAP